MVTMECLKLHLVFRILKGRRFNWVVNAINTQEFKEIIKAKPNGVLFRLIIECLNILKRTFGKNLYLNLQVSVTAHRCAVGIKIKKKKNHEKEQKENNLFKL